MLSQAWAGILHEGMKLWTEERRHQFQNKYSKILSEISEAANTIYPDYTDAALGLSNEELHNFVTAYWHEIKKETAS